MLGSTYKKWLFQTTIGNHRETREKQQQQLYVHWWLFHIRLLNRRVSLGILIDGQSFGDPAQGSPQHGSAGKNT
jgi:hypothetical protein